MSRQVIESLLRLQDPDELEEWFAIPASAPTPEFNWAGSTTPVDASPTRNLVVLHWVPEAVQYVGVNGKHRPVKILSMCGDVKVPLQYSVPSMTENAWEKSVVCRECARFWSSR